MNEIWIHATLDAPISFKCIFKNKNKNFELGAKERE
jgi:hypothetical protein